MKTNKLTIGYGQHIVQQDLTLNIERGEMVCVLGTNGCGKSTLFQPFI
jgi:iron complex transport system ATP-binding protein